MSGVIDSLERAQARRLPRFDAGDRVRVHFQVVEGGRRRTQVFEGVVLKRQGSGVRETFTVRKESFGVGVERTFPAHSPKIERIEVASRGEVRRAKLYYLRERVGRAARVRERRWVAGQDDAEAAMPIEDEAPRPGEAELAETTSEAEAGETSAEGEAEAAETGAEAEGDRAEGAAAEVPSDAEASGDEPADPKGAPAEQSEPDEAPEDAVPDGAAEAEGSSEAGSADGDGDGDQPA